MQNKSGIYLLKCLENNKIYVGSTDNLHQRKIKHFRDLNNNNHANPYLQEDFNKYGEEKITFEIIEFLNYLNTNECNDYFCERENFYMDKFKSHIKTYGKEFGYNIYRARRDSLESKRKKSDSLKGQKFTQERKNKISKTKKEKGVAKGEKNPNFGKPSVRRTLTEEQCYEIKKLLLEDTDERVKDKCERIANLYNVTAKKIGIIRDGNYYCSEKLGGGIKNWLKEDI